jgi:hypothetical protein
MPYCLSNPRTGGTCADVYIEWNASLINIRPAVTGKSEYVVYSPDCPRKEEAEIRTVDNNHGSNSNHHLKFLYLIPRTVWSLHYLT